MGGRLLPGRSTPSSVGRLGGVYGSGDGVLQSPAAVAFVVREFGNGGRLQFFATPDAVAMAAMSIARTFWMATVARARNPHICFAFSK